jgi:hypothetical protein
MAKAVRFPRKLEVWVPDSMANAYETLAADHLLSVSDHLRLALQSYLRANGITPQPTRSINGQQHQEANRHGV